MSERELMISRKLSKLDLNRINNEIQIYTHWCRIAYAAFEKWDHKEHAHSFWELHLCLGGSACIQIDGTEYTLTENTYVFFSPKSKHTILFESGNYSEFVWGFSIEDNQEINEILCNKYKNTKLFKADKEMLNSDLMILDNTEKSEFGYYHIIKNELYHIFALLVRKVGVKNRGIYHKSKNNEVNIIRKYIYENLDSDISIDDVSLFSGISKSSIKRMFKKEYNKTFSQIKREMRAQVISELLRETDYTMEEIADATGFSDRYSMGKFFKKIEGATPGEYRRGISK